MKFKIIIPALIFTLISFPLIGKTITNPFKLPAGTTASSYSHSSFSSLVNPVFSAEKDSPIISYSFSQTDDINNYNHLFSLNLLGFNFIYGKYGYLYNETDDEFTSDKADFYQLNKAFFIKNSFGLGAGISFAKSSDYSYDERLLNLGFILRPSKYISMGYSIQDIDIKDNSTKTGFTENYSLSIRPLNHLTVTASCDKFSEDNYSNMDYSLILELETFKGIKIRGGIGNNNYYNLSASIPMDLAPTGGGSLGIGYHYASGKNEKRKQHGPDIYISGNKNSDSINRSFIKRTAYLRLNKKIQENKETGLFSSNGMNFEEILRSINSMGLDDSIKALFIEIDNADMGMGQIQELRKTMISMRRMGKKVYVHLNKSGNKEYYIACAADRIYHSPGSGFSITGLSAQLYFIKSLLNKGGIKYESIRYGKYKSFNETFTRDKMSPELKENLESILKDLNNQFITAISEERKIKAEIIEDIFNTGFKTPKEAKIAGFIDEVGYSNDFLDKLSPARSIVKINSYYKDTVLNSQWGPIPIISIVHVSGTIMDGENGSGSGSVITNGTFHKSLETAFKTGNAVVIRINSGGGSATASDFMFKSILTLKKKYKKPVIFSFGNTTASGGYYIACTGDKIFSNDGTITGSIGVIAGKISLKRLYKKLGINKETIKLSPYADIFTESRDLSKEERDVLQKSVNFFYKRFTSIVMNGRKIKPEKIDSLAQGRVFTGRQAKRNGLSDTAGGLIGAIEFAKLKTGKKGYFKISHFPRKSSLFSISNFMGMNMKSAAGAMKYIRQIENLSRISDSNGYMQPYYLKIK